MNPMTALAALAMLAAVIAAYAALICRDRVRSLEWMAVENDRLLQQNAEMLCQLDDAEREAQRLRIANAYHIREGLTMMVDLEWTERQRAWLAANYRYAKEAQAGAMLVAMAEVAGVEMVSREGDVL